jgi:hypothetical protein
MYLFNGEYKLRFELFFNATFPMGKTSVRKWIADLCFSLLRRIHIMYCSTEQEQMYAKQARCDCSSVDTIAVCIFLRMILQQKETVFSQPGRSGQHIYRVYLTLSVTESHKYYKVVLHVRASLRICTMHLLQQCIIIRNRLRECSTGLLKPVYRLSLNGTI